MMLLMSWFLVGAMEGAWLSPHEEDYRANLHQVIEPPSSITQPVLKTGRRIVGSDWQVHGYYPYWGNQDAEIPWSALSHLLYFSLELNADGTLGDEHQWSTRGQSLVEEGHRHGVKVLPCVTMFDDEAIRTLLSQASSRSAAIDILVDRVVGADADGVNLDFEFVPASNGESPTPKENFVTFVEDLKTALNAVDPSLEVTLATPAVDWSGTYDYDALAEASDGLLIMGYGYHWAGGAPGPIAPIESGETWASRSLTWTLDDYDTYGLIQNRSKFILGLPLYGRQWPTESSEIPGVERSSGVAVSMSQCDTDFANGKRWDEESLTPYKVFELSGGWEQLFCEDVASLEAKFGLIERRDIGGVMFWDVSKIPGDHEAWTSVQEVFGVTLDDSDPGSTDDSSDPTDPLDDVSDTPDPSEPTTPGQGPVVVISAPNAAVPGQPVALDASRTYDPDGRALTFSWSQEMGPAVVWSTGRRDSTVTVILQDIGTHRFEVEVSNGENSAVGIVEVIGLTTPAEDEGGCAQNDSGLWLLLLIGVQFATQRTQTYKGRRATPL
ncbi:MAG: glycosyl hydrolase family 18 protein [Myxococcota bacterium]|nr:glycosyl hydrolase family 18 protein [Myxococcota bacterium]